VNIPNKYSDSTENFIFKKGQPKEAFKKAVLKN
jgi:hypothetical protein